MKRVEFVIGIGKDRDNHPVRDAEVKIQQVSRVAADTFGGFSLTYGTGGWISPTNGLVMESNVSLVTLTDEPTRTIQDFALHLKEVFNQESILVTTTVVEVEFV